MSTILSLPWVPLARLGMGKGEGYKLKRDLCTEADMSSLFCSYLPEQKQHESRRIQLVPEKDCWAPPDSFVKLHVSKVHGVYIGMHDLEAHVLPFSQILAHHGFVEASGFGKEFCNLIRTLAQHVVLLQNSATLTQPDPVLSTSAMLPTR